MDLRTFDPESDVGEATLSAVLIATNVGLVAVMLLSTDRVRRAENERMLQIMDRVLAEEEEGDKHKYDAAYGQYVAEAPEGTEARLFEKLGALAAKCEGAVATQPDHLNTVEKLLAASEEFNDRVHEVLGKFVAAFGGGAFSKGFRAFSVTSSGHPF